MTRVRSGRMARLLLWVAWVAVAAPLLLGARVSAQEQVPEERPAVSETEEPGSVSGADDPSGAELTEDEDAAEEDQEDAGDAAAPAVTGAAGGFGAFLPIFIEKDVPILLRDGEVLQADVFRPQEVGEYPAIVTLGPYPKDIPFADWNPTAWEELSDPGEHMHWETVDPDWWVPQGYVVVRVDARGTGKSRDAGPPRLLALGEAEDYSDVVEWASTRGWSNGKVGILGISYFAMAAWRVAALAPPGLAAVVPWEGAVDLYRDVSRHGGIRSNTFAERWLASVAEYSEPTPEDETPLVVAAGEELIGDAVRANAPDLAAIRAPLLSAGNWGGPGLHLPGNIRGFEEAGSEFKMLEIHVGSHIGPFYSMQGRLLQKRFLDYWLKGIDTGIDREPPIKLAIRLGGDRYEWRYEYEWPIARTRWTPFYVDVDDRSLGPRQAASATEVSYSAEPGGGRASVTFTTAPFERRTEVTGPAKLKLWVSSSADDADLFVIVRHLDGDGVEVTYPGTNQPELAAAYGWLRVSHRHLDEARSQPWRPVHTHDRLEKLVPGEIVPVEVEILPTSFVLRKGHRLVVEVGAEDDPRVFPFTHTDPDDRQLEGQVTIHSGGSYDSHLLLPVVPKAR